MTLTTPFRKVYQGIANRHQMYRMFDRHAQRPNRWQDDDGALYAGEFFEIGQADHDRMFEILPPLKLSGEMFAMREFLTGMITSVFYSLPIDGTTRYFHGYCDLSDKGSPDRMRRAVLERESLPVRAMTREERIEHIWSITHDDYRGYAGEDWPQGYRGLRTVLVYDRRHGTTLKILDHLTDGEIAAKLPVHLRFLPDAVAA